MPSLNLTPASRRSAPDAFAVVLQAGLQEDAVGPHIHVSPRRQIALLPTLILALPLGRQPRDHRRRQVRRVLAQQGRQRLLEIAGRDVAQVQHRQQRIQAPGAPRPQWQDRRVEPDPLAVTGRPAVPYLRPRDLHRSDAGRNRSGRAVTMPHDTGAPVGKLQILHRGKKRLDFDLHGLRQKLPRASAQNIGQWIVDLVGLTKGNNIASLVHGASLSLRGSGRLDTRLDTPPISGRHHPLSRIALIVKFWYDAGAASK